MPIFSVLDASNNQCCFVGLFVPYLVCLYFTWRSKKTSPAWQSVDFEAKKSQGSCSWPEIVNVPFFFFFFSSFFSFYCSKTVLTVPLLYEAHFFLKSCFIAVVLLRSGFPERIVPCVRPSLCLPQQKREPAAMPDRGKSEEEKKEQVATSHFPK